MKFFSNIILLSVLWDELFDPAVPSGAVGLDNNLRKRSARHMMRLYLTPISSVPEFASLNAFNACSRTNFLTNNKSGSSSLSEMRCDAEYLWLVGIKPSSPVFEHKATTTFIAHSEVAARFLIAID